MFHKIIKVLPKENLIIEVEFEDKTRKIYNVKEVINKWTIFENLKDEEIFKNVKVDVGGYRINWNEDIDLSCEEIWQNGEKID